MNKWVIVFAAIGVACTAGFIADLVRRLMDSIWKTDDLFWKDSDE